MFNREDTVPPLRGTVVPWVNRVRMAIAVKGPGPGIVTYFTTTTMSDKDWQQALEALPATPARIPAFFFSHGSPMLAVNGRNIAHHGPSGPLFRFLSHFGPTLLKKYKPKGILVFSAHWETSSERQGLYFYCLFEVLVNIAIFSDGVR